MNSNNSSDNNFQRSLQIHRTNSSNENSMNIDETSVEVC
jgi:hypothetical protein